MIGKIAVVEFVLVVALVGAGVFYYRYTEGVIDGLTADKATLQEAVTTQQATITAQQQAASQQAAQMIVLQQNIDKAETDRRALQDKFQQKNLSEMARNNSADLEKRINTATQQAFQDIVTITTPQDQPPIPVAPTTSNQTSSKVVTQPTTSAKSTLPLNYQPPPTPPKGP